jgi:colicin import membrane protein
LDPFGEVHEVRIRRSSGNPLFDRSAEAAVKKASPLPVPTDVTIYNRFFREFQFEFDPEKGIR